MKLGFTLQGLRYPVEARDDDLIIFGALARTLQSSGVLAHMKDLIAKEKYFDDARLDPRCVWPEDCFIATLRQAARRVWALPREFRGTTIEGPDKKLHEHLNELGRGEGRSNLGDTAAPSSAMGSGQ